LWTTDDYGDDDDDDCDDDDVCDGGGEDNDENDHDGSMKTTLVFKIVLWPITVLTDAHRECR